MIESKKSLQVTRETSFPKLMIGKDTGRIILATSAQRGLLTGVIVYPGHADRVGEYRTEWINDMFKDYDQEVTLKNK
jgi:hypothetical protein